VRRTRELKRQNIELREEVNLLNDLYHKLQHQLQVIEEQQKVNDDKFRKEMKKKVKAAKPSRNIDRLPSIDSSAVGTNVGPASDGKNGGVFSSITNIFSFN
jgi:hypothetical protein